MKPLVILGSGGHAFSCLEIVESLPDWEFVGFLDQGAPRGGEIAGLPILGSDDLIPQLVARGVTFCIGIGSIRTALPRRRLADQLTSAGARIATLISPLASVSKRSMVGEGSVVMPFAHIGSRAVLGRHSILNTGAIVEHDCVVGDFCHVSTQSVLNGGVQVGSGTYVGSGSIVNLGLVLGDEVVLGSGSVVTRSLPEAGLYWGAPAQRKAMS